MGNNGKTHTLAVKYNKFKGCQMCVYGLKSFASVRLIKIFVPGFLYTEREYRPSSDSVIVFSVAANTITNMPVRFIPTTTNNIQSMYLYTEIMYSLNIHKTSFYNVYRFLKRQLSSCYSAHVYYAYAPYMQIFAQKFSQQLSTTMLRYMLRLQP